MKISVLKLAAVICAAVMAGGCSLIKSRSDSEMAQAIAQSEKKDGFTVVDCGRISYEVSKGWNKTIDDENGNGYPMYWDLLTGSGYGLVDIRSDEGFSAEEIVAHADKFYGKEYSAKHFEELSDKITNADGDELRYMIYDMTVSEVNMMACLVFCEEKNLVVYYKAQNDDEKDPEFYIVPQLKKMALSTKFKERENKLSNGCFIQEFQNMTFEFSGGDFIIYTDGKDNYDSGKCEILRGMEAVDRVASLNLYFYSKEDQINSIRAKQAFFDDYYAVIFNTEQVVRDGESIASEPAQNVYVGFYNEQTDSFDMTDCETFYFGEWTRLTENSSDNTDDIS